MNFLDPTRHDVMQVCRNGHVITDLLRALPERALSHCDRCGAVTLDRCLTCGEELPGSVYVPEAVPIGDRRPPQYCSACGAAFPWTLRPEQRLGPSAHAVLERFLRRLPRVIRELRNPQGLRPRFRIEQQSDLEDLIRALLPLYFDDIRYEGRTPSYALGNRTDFWLSPSSIAVTVKRASFDVREPELLRQLREDVDYYEGRRNCRRLLYFVYDPEMLLVEPRRLETTWRRSHDSLEVCPVIAS